MDVKTSVLRMLRSKDGYISGQEMCRQLGVSRTTVWKAMNQLKEEGYSIDAAQNRGYRLAAVPDIVTASEIMSRLNTSWAGWPTVSFDSIDSTNNEAKRRAEAGAGQGLMLIAEEQTAGKGRRGHSWSTPAGCAISMSLLLKPDIEPSSAAMLTLVTALAVNKALRENTGLDVKIKWPNDMVVNGKKLCGILTEMSAEIGYINHVVIGIGMNVNNDRFPEGAENTATSLMLELGRPVQRAQIAAAILEKFEGCYDRFLKAGDLSFMTDEYNSELVNLGREVCVLAPDGEWRGTAEGIDRTGALLVRDKAGRLVGVDSGEVSVRGVYGYV